MKRGIFRNKRGTSGGESIEGDIVMPEIIFIILNIIYFGLLIVFVVKSSTGAWIYEQAYAKQIALVLDQSKPGMTISMNFTKAIQIADKNKRKKENTFKIDSSKNKVILTLSNSGGYSYNYFVDYDITYKFDGNNLVFNIKDKTPEEKTAVAKEEKNAA